MYMVNGSWDIVIAVLIVSVLPLNFESFTKLFPKAVFWVETKGKTLEEIDEIFEGEKHSNVPDVEMVRKWKVNIDVGVIDQELHEEVETVKMKEN